MPDRIKRLLIILNISFLIANFIACSNINCPLQNTVAVNYELRLPINSVGDSRTDTLPAGDTLWIWSQRADGQDTLLFNRGTGITKFSLPVSGNNPEDMLVFFFADSMGYAVDTLWIEKQDRPHFESVDCQAAFFHTLTNVRHTQRRIDSVAINNDDVTFDPLPTHIYLFLK